VRSPERHRSDRDHITTGGRRHLLRATAAGPATPAGAQCLPPANDPEAYERGRMTAALDLELRREGGVLLAEGEGAGKTQALGTITRAGAKRTMTVGSRSCGEYAMPSFGLDAKGAVFEVMPRYHAAEHRKVAVCELSCHYGCGANLPPTEVVVDVPVHAHWVGVRTIDVPIDVEVEETFPPTAECGPGPP
jgi:hypothetical protein